MLQFSAPTVSHYSKEQCFEGSQVSPALPSDETCIKMMVWTGEW